MKIDFIISDLKAGGAQRVMVLLANYFSKKSYEIRIITFNPGLAYQLNDNIALIELHYGKIPNHTIRSLYNLIIFYYNKKNRPNLIISFVTQLNLKAIIAAKIYGIKIIVSEHNSYLRAQHPLYLTNFTRNYLYPLVEYLTVLTAFDIEYYRKRGVNVLVMPNPCTFKVLNKSDHKRDKVILAVGHLDRYHHKGFDNLVTLIAPILKENPDWILKIIGDGDKGMKYLKNLVILQGLEKKVIFTGFRSDVNFIMQNSEIFILPSRFEGLPMVLLEALSQGMSCIAYDCKTGPSDIIQNEINGLIIEDQNMEAMSKGLVKLIKNENLRKRVRQNAIKSIDRYSMENIGDLWEDVFAKL